jgi:hypothetical protein
MPTPALLCWGALLSPALPPSIVPAPEAVVARWHGSGTPRLLRGLHAPTEGAEPLARAADFLSRHGAAVGLPPALRPVSARALARGTRVVLEQVVAGLPVLDRSAVITLDAAGAVVAVSSDLEPLTAPMAARVDAAGARGAAARAVGVPAEGPVAARAQVRAVALALGDVAHAAYEVRLLDRVVRVDGRSGEVLSVRPGFWR